MPDHTMHDVGKASTKYKKYFHYLTKYTTVKKVNNILLNRREMAQRKLRLKSFPVHIGLDTGNACNLKCPACPTGWHDPNRLPPKFMKLDQFQQIVDELSPYVLKMSLFRHGEPLLSKKLFDMVEYAASKNVATAITSNMSVNNLTAERAEEMVKSGLTHVYASIDGATQGAYEKYRISGDLELCYDNIRLILATRKRLGSRFPLVSWKYILFPHNYTEVAAARAKAIELGVDSFETQLGGEDISNFGERRHFDEESKEFKTMDWLVPDFCTALWSSTDITSTGEVLPCCVGYRPQDIFGNILESGFRAVWNGPRYVEARRVFVEKTEINSAPCNECGIPYKAQGLPPPAGLHKKNAKLPVVA